MAVTKLTEKDVAFTVQSQANSGNAGGTIYYINQGGIKRAWGVTGAYSVAGNSTLGMTLVFPAGFFTTITGCSLSLTNLTSDGRQLCFFAANPTATGATVQVQGVTGAATAVGGQLAWEVVGT